MAFTRWYDHCLYYSGKSSDELLELWQEYLEADDTTIEKIEYKGETLCLFEKDGKRLVPATDQREAVWGHCPPGKRARVDVASESQEVD